MRILIVTLFILLTGLCRMSAQAGVKLRPTSDTLIKMVGYAFTDGNSSKIRITYHLKSQSDHPVRIRMDMFYLDGSPVDSSIRGESTGDIGEVLPGLDRNIYWNIPEEISGDLVIKLYTGDNTNRPAPYTRGPELLAGLPVIVASGALGGYFYSEYATAIKWYNNHYRRNYDNIEVSKNFDRKQYLYKNAWIWGSGFALVSAIAGGITFVRISKINKYNNAISENRISEMKTKSRPGPSVSLGIKDSPGVGLTLSFR